MQFPFHPEEFKKYFYNTSWLLGERILRCVATLIIGILLARYLGPKQFGILNYAISFVLLFLNITSLGLDDILPRELVKNPSHENELLGTAFLLRLFSGIFSILLIILINIWRQENFAIISIIIIIALGLIFKPFLIIESFFYSKVTSQHSAKAYLFALVIFFLLQIALILIKAPLIWFAFAILLDGIILALGLSYNYLKQNKKFHAWKHKRNVAISLLHDSWPLILSGMTISIYMRIDQIMIKNMLDVTQVGIYSIAVRISEAWYFIPVLICSSLFPAIIKFKEHDFIMYNHRLRQLYSLMILLALSIAIPISFFSKNIISLLFGTEYIGATSVLKIHIWSAIFVFLGVASSRYLLAENFTKISLITTSASMLINIILNFILIPLYGIKGAAIATLFSCFSATFLIIFFKKTYSQGILMIKAFNVLRLFK
ncbi:MAG TPA: flippase [Candidatus Omnitrophota bacterium]|nr:flippase [Candidatus Omnitrophota bacterium]